MVEIEFFAICSHCEKVFANADIGTPCPICGSEMIGRRANKIIDGYVAESAIDLMQQYAENELNLAIEKLREFGYEYQSNISGLDALKEI